MKPQVFTPHHQSLIKYLDEVVKIPREKYHFGDTHGDVKGKIDQLHAATLIDGIGTNSQDNLTAVFDVTTATELRFTNGFSIHLMIKEFEGELSVIIGQLLFWLAQNKQDIEFDYKAYWDNEKSCNLECWFDIEERALGSLETGFAVN